MDTIFLRCAYIALLGLTSPSLWAEPILDGKQQQTTKAKGEYVVVLDAGHGGSFVAGESDGRQEGDGSSANNATAAPVGGKRFLEKELTLAYALEIERAFAQSERARALNIRVVQTRRDDRHLSSIMRAAIAVEYDADIFLSIHFNASNGHNASGTKAYVVSEDHPKWEYMHFTNPYIQRDRAFGQRLVKQVAAALQPFGGKPDNASVHGDSWGDGGHLKDGIRMLGFARQDTHLHDAAIALLEVEFIDNPSVVRWLLSDANRNAARQAVARAIVEAVCDQLEDKTHATTRARKSPGR